MLTAVLEQGTGSLWLVIFALLMAAISVFYYFKVIMAMYFTKGDTELSAEITLTDKLVLGIACAVVIVVGIAPDMPGPALEFKLRYNRFVYLYPANLSINPIKRLFCEKTTAVSILVFGIRCRRCARQLTFRWVLKRISFARQAGNIKW